MTKISKDIKYVGRIKAFDCKKCGQPLWMLGCGNPECEDYWNKPKEEQIVFAIVDQEKKYIIKSANDIYTMYNDFIIDGIFDNYSDQDIVEQIREFYNIVYEKIDKTKDYDLSQFEEQAIKILD
jgi:hypothetical protein